MAGEEVRLSWEVILPETGSKMIFVKAAVKDKAAVRIPDISAIIVYDLWEEVQLGRVYW